MTQAIYDSFPGRAIEYWNSSVYVVAAPNSNQNRNGPPPSKKQKTSDRWQQISDAYKALPDHAAKANWEAKRNGKDGDNIAPGFRISGLGQLIDAGIESDRFLVFGD